jgi:hypothetical protein
MANPWMYECFTCKRNGVGGVVVYLDGKGVEGRTKYPNKDKTSHIHQTNGTAVQQSLTSRQPTDEQLVPLLRIINAKLDRLLSEVSNRDGRDDDGKLGDGLYIE